MTMTTKKRAAPTKKSKRRPAANRDDDDDDDVDAEEEETRRVQEEGRIGTRLRGLVTATTVDNLLPDELLTSSLLAGIDIDLLLPHGVSRGKQSGKKRKKKRKSQVAWYENDMCYALTWIIAHVEPFLDSEQPPQAASHSSSSPQLPSSPRQAIPRRPLQAIPRRPRQVQAPLPWDQDPRLCKLLHSPMLSTVPRSRLGPFSTIPPPSMNSYPTVCMTCDAPSSTDKSPE